MNEPNEKSPKQQRWSDLSGGQRMFLRSLHGNPTTLEQMLRRQKIASPRFSAWMRTKKFRRALDAVMVELRRRRELTIELGSLCGSEKLSRMIRSQKPHIARLACMGMLQMVGGEAQAKRAPERAKRGRGAGEAQAGAPSELPAGLSQSDAEQLLTQLESQPDRAAKS